MELGRIKIKVVRDKVNVWAHFCYTDYVITNKFEAMFPPTTDLSRYTYWVRRWAEEDFDIIPNTWEKLEFLKTVIKNMYKQKHPELYLDSSVDRQGWARVWVNKHMEEEINNELKKRN